MNSPKLSTRRLENGHYLVNDRFDLRRRSNGAGGLYDHGTTWFWSDRQGVIKGSYYSTKAEALDALGALLATAAPKPLNTVYAVNRELKALGETPRLRAGRGYYYFDGDAIGWPSSSVYVCYSDDLTVEQWLGEYRDLKATAVAWGRA
jgi:hypothetical protein